MIFFVLACLQAPQDASNIQIDGESLSDRIVQLEERAKKREQDMAEDILVLINKMEKIENRVKTIEITLTDIRPQIFMAKEIGFTPLATKLSAKDVQAAVEEIEGRLRIIEQGLAEDPNQPGEGLFENRNHGRNKTDKGQPKHGPNHQEPEGHRGPNSPPNGEGNGPKGPPP